MGYVVQVRTCIPEGQGNSRHPIEEELSQLGGFDEKPSPELLATNFTGVIM